MSTNTDFDFLVGTVRVESEAPVVWQREGLVEFFTDPNNEAWGAPLCRKLYHETLHFWQLLGWGYVANCAAVDWQRVIKFEKTGVIVTSPTDGLASMFETGNHPFSPRELMEATARFWDVHTRSPAQIIVDEQIPTDEASGPLTMPDPHGGLTMYTNHAFDFVMQHGADCRKYAKPYRWLLDRVQGQSAFAVIMFPLCAHAAMGTPDPVAVFCEAINLAYEHPMIRWLMNHRSGSIHNDWMMFWPPLAKNIFGPASMKGGVVAFTSGFDVIERGGLRDHPIYREYPEKAMFRGFFKLHKPTSTSQHPGAVQLARELRQAALENPYVLFALPGEPTFRRALAETVPPPVVRFPNFELSANRPAQGKILAAQNGTPWDDTFALISADVERRAARFRAAEHAVSIGLPPNAFEQASENLQSSRSA